MMPMDFFGNLLAKIKSVGFSPIQEDQNYRPNYSLHTLIRDEVGMSDRVEIKDRTEKSVEKLDDANIKRWSISADLADVAYWDFEIYRGFLREVHCLLDDELSFQMSKRTNALVWASEIDRTESEIVNLLEKMQSSHPNMSAPPKAVKRPSANKMILEGKIFGAVGNTCSVAVANGADYGDLFESLTEQPRSNEDLLKHLDLFVTSNKMNRTVGDKISLVPRSFVLAHQNFKNQLEKESQPIPTMTDYLRFLQVSNNLSGNSDQRLIDRFESAEQK
jgi:hypothetical protein